jgi:hypothetical protein
LYSLYGIKLQVEAGPGAVPWADSATPRCVANSREIANMRRGREHAAKVVRRAVTLFFLFQAACGPEPRDDTINQGLGVDSAEAVSRARQAVEPDGDTAHHIAIEDRCFTRLDNGVLITFSLTAIPYPSEAGELVTLTGFTPIAIVGVADDGAVSMFSMHQPPLSMTEAPAAESDRPREERPGWHSEPVDSSQAVQLALDALVRAGMQLGDEPLLHCYEEVEIDDEVNDRLIKTGALVTWISQHANVAADTLGGAQVTVSVHGLTSVAAVF